MTNLQRFNTLDHHINAYHQKSDTCNVNIHLHDCYEIFVAVSDNICYYVEGNSYQLNSGDIIITNENEIHRPLTTDDRSYERIFIQFRPYSFSHFFTTDYNPLEIFTNRQLGKNNLFKPFPSMSDKISTLITDITSLGRTLPYHSLDMDNKNAKFPNIKSHRNQHLLRTLILQLIIYLHDSFIHNSVTPEHHQVYNTSKIDLRVKSVLEYIDSSYTQSFSLDQLSQTHYMDKYYLSHLFKETTGFTILEYIQSKRIKKAKSLISQHISMTKVCELCGYDDYSNFYKTFKKLVHMSPKAYKDLITNTTF